MTSLGKRPNPYATQQSRAHMSALREGLVEEFETLQDEEQVQRGDWSDEDDQEPWKKCNM